MPGFVDHLAIQVISRMARHGLELPEGWLAEECPGWPESLVGTPYSGVKRHRTGESPQGGLTPAVCTATASCRAER